MAELEVDVYRKSRPAGSFPLTGEPDDTGAVAEALRGWLEGEGVHPELWPQFHANVRVAGAWGIRKRGVRA